MRHLVILVIEAIIEIKFIYLLSRLLKNYLFIYLFEGIHYSMIYQRNELLKLLSVKVLGS